MPAWTDPPTLIDVGNGSLCYEGEEGDDEEGWVLMEFWDENEEWEWVASEKEYRGEDWISRCSNSRREGFLADYAVVVFSSIVTPNCACACP